MAQRKRLSSRDMALAELARCFGDDRVVEIVRTIQSRAWLLTVEWRNDRPEDYMTQATVHGAEMSAVRAAVALALADLDLDDLMVDVQPFSLSRDEIANAREAHDLPTMRRFLQEWADYLEDDPNLSGPRITIREVEVAFE